MISNGAYNYCKDDVSLIENYHLAINDKTQMWECHHRLEIDLNVSPQYLKEHDLYLNRPASELIFLTKAEHMSLHHKGRPNSKEQIEKMRHTVITNGTFKGKNNPMYGKNAEDYMSRDAVIEKRKKQSKGVLKEKNGRYHTKQMYKDGIYETVKYDDIQKRLNEGWIIKGRPWTNRSKK